MIMGLENLPYGQKIRFIKQTKRDMCQMFWVKLLSIELLYTFLKIIYENNPFNYEKWLGNKFFFWKKWSAVNFLLQGKNSIQ